MYNVSVAAESTPAHRRGGEVDNLLTLIVLVSAEVLSHLIKKWLDKHLESDAHDSDDDADDGHQNGR